MEPTEIIIKGACEHNLRNIDIKIPKKELVVFTGVSGSGKSSLAFDILYAEGQRRYVESLSAYARQFLGQMPKPHFESIRGLSPAISIEQKSTSKNPRSTVGTVTEIYDYLRVLFANIGEQYCPSCDKLVSKQTSQEIFHQILKDFNGKVQIIAPIIENRKGEFLDLFENLKADGYQRLKINDEIINLDDGTPKLNKKKKHDISLIVSRVDLNKVDKASLKDQIEEALRYGKEVCAVEEVKGDNFKKYSREFACIPCGISFHQPTAQSFSFNSPIGMCESCNGLGYKTSIDPNLIIEDENKSILEGAIKFWNDSSLDGEGWDGAILHAVLEFYKINPHSPWRKLPQKKRHIILFGSGGQKIPVKYHAKNGNKWSFSAGFNGVIPNIERRYQDSKSERRREYYARFMSEAACRECKGARIKQTSQSIKISDKGIVDICQLTIKEAEIFFSQLTLKGNKKIIAAEVLKEISSRLNFLVNVGLEYLTLDRKAPTLSGGESQRIRLASQIGSELSGVMYILDEPSIGLHQKDNLRLLESLKHLRNLGNSVLVIEHDEDTIRNADYIVDFGPGAGSNGGQITYSGSFKKLLKAKKTLTGDYLSGRKKIETPKKRRKGNGGKIVIHEPKMNNLKIKSVEFPLGKIIGVTGVSGAGKSTLINQILVPVITNKLNNSDLRPHSLKKIEGLEDIDKLINIDQSPIGRSSRSNPATYTKVYDIIRELYANLPESKKRGYKSGRFSFNVKGGRCEACEGAGNKIVEMHFLPDVFVECEECLGKRFNDATLEVTFKGKNIADILNLTVLEAFKLFEAFPKIKNILQTLIDVGVDYIHLGQQSTTLSGGEAQRIKLSRELCKRQTGKTLYVLDEPTTGLHFEDISKLLSVINRLCDSGNSIIIVEHNLDVIRSADYIIDLGPDGGSGGGKIIAKGTPEQISKISKSYTGSFLKNVI